MSRVNWPSIAAVALVWLAIAANTVFGSESMTVRILAVHDADTLWVQHGATKQKIRLAWVDAPEIGQPYGDKAQHFAEKMLLGKTVIFTYGKSQSYDRLVGEIILSGGYGYNATLVQAGYAWVDQRYSRNHMLLDLQAKAKAAKRGLWAGTRPVAPWVWRKKKH